MPLVSQYSHLQKLGDGVFQKFTGLRAAGLAVEQGFRACPEKGLGSLCLEDLEEVQVKGTLRVQDQRQWRAARTCSLQVHKPEARLAKAVVEKTRTFLSDVGLNIFHVDCPMPERLGRYDFLCDFSRPRASTVKGLLWVEVKVMSASRAGNAIAEEKEKLQDKLLGVHRLEPRVDGVMLLVAKTTKDSRVSWRQPALEAFLYSLNNQSWQKLSPQGRVARGHCQGLKPPLPQVYAAMEWHMVRNKPWGLLRQFLSAMGLASGNAGKRAKTFNSILGPRQKLIQKYLKDKCGQKPWIGTKPTFKAIHMSL